MPVRLALGVHTDRTAAACNAGPSVHGHLSNIMPPLLQLASTPAASGGERPEAACQAIARIVATVTEVPPHTLRHAPPHWRRLTPRIRRL